MLYVCTFVCITYSVYSYLWCFRLLDSSCDPQFEKYLTTYADILYRWQLLSKRAEILKYVLHPQPQQLEIGKLDSFLAVMFEGLE